MAWSFDPFSEQDPIDIFGLVQHSLSQLSPLQSQSVKVATSDSDEDKPAHGVVMYSLDGINAPKNSPQAPWNYKVFDNSGHSTSDFESLCNEAIVFINTLSDSQQYYAEVTLMDAHTHQLRLAVWYPSN